VSTNDTEVLKQTLTELLQRRLDQLSSEATRTLEACVVLAKNCSFRRLEKVLEIPRHQLLRAIEELDDRGLIEVSDGFIVSSHALLSDAVERRMAPSVKSMLHASVAAILQQEIDSSSAGHLQWDCAEQWRLAGDDEKAASVLRRCAQDSMKIGRATDAAATYFRLLRLRSSDEVRLEVIGEALLTLAASISWKNGSTLLEERRTLRQRLGLPSGMHDGAEIMGLTRLFQLGEAPSNYVNGLLQCLTASDASEVNRLFACRQLLMIAEMTLDSGLAELAYRAVPESPSKSLRHALTSMVFHTCFGLPEEAKHLASRVFEETQNEPTLLPHFLNAAYAEYRIGDCTVAEARFTQALELAHRANSLAGKMHARVFLARLYYSLGKLDSARSWYNEFTKLLSEGADDDLVWEHNLLGALLCLKEGSLDLARGHLDTARLSRFSQLALPSLTVRSCEAELRLLEGGEPCTNLELDELIALYERSRTFGGQDDVVRALTKSLRFQKRELEAAALVAEYLTMYRRDGYPPDPVLVISARGG
jgi:tetratricopeptide (TPR) repeat protein